MVSTKCLLQAAYASIVGRRVRAFVLGTLSVPVVQERMKQNCWLVTFVNNVELLGGLMAP